MTMNELGLATLLFMSLHYYDVIYFDKMNNLALTASYLVIPTAHAELATDTAA